MADSDQGSTNLHNENENNSLLTCYDKKATDKIVSEITKCMETNMEDTIFSTDAIKSRFQARFVEIYKAVLDQNMQIGDNVPEGASSQDSVQSSQSSGSVVNEMKEKYFNQELMPELDRLILAVANCRKTTPYSCVKMFAEQCSHECRTETKREVQLDPKSPLKEPENDSDLLQDISERVTQSCSAVSGLSVSLPQAIEDVSNLEKVLEMQSSVGKSKVDHIVFNGIGLPDVGLDKPTKRNATEVLEEDYGKRSRLENFSKGFIKNT